MISVAQTSNTSGRWISDVLKMAWSVPSSASWCSHSMAWVDDIISPRKACKNRRVVLIFRTRPGADAKVGSTRSYKGMVDNGYYWTFFKEGAAQSGRYYAKVKPTDKCQGGQSKTLRGPA